MNRRFFAQLATTAIGSPILMLLAFELERTNLRWLALPFSAPGLAVASVIFPQTVHGENAESFLQWAFALNFFFLWILLLAVVKLAEVYLAQRKTATH